MTSIIKTEVLRAAVVSAFDRGRYSVRFETQPTGADLAVVPSSITLDLGERDDDLLGVEMVAEAMEAFVSDDHGAAIPAPGTYERDGLKVYEFALQDAWPNWGIPKLETCALMHAPDLQAASHADWVHVYDRKTRERRTLKRPAADAVVKGLTDVAADLREKPMFAPRMPEDAFSAVLHGREDREALPGHWRIFRDGDRVIYEPFSEPPKPRSIGEKLTVTDAEGVRGPGEVVELLGSAFRVEVQFPHTDSSGDKADSYRWFFKNNETECYGLKLEFTPFSEPVEATVPVVLLPGPLKSSEGLVRGDVLRHKEEGLCRVRKIYDRTVSYQLFEPGRGGGCDFTDFALVGRPDADGWMDWPGGENPVGDAAIEFSMRQNKGPYRNECPQQLRWSHENTLGDIVRFRLVDMPPLKGDA